ncbi:MAG: hypothetical protein JNM26_12855, partial [Ideonella sp.]|nr:hypothetical protein [Ideonella sp.]
MPAILPRFRAARSATAGLGAALTLVLAPLASVHAQTPSGTGTAATSPRIQNSPMDAALFYQLLIGEIELSAGSPGAAFEVVLDAARKQRSEQLFKRAADIALQARAGEQALTAARAWRTALPASIEAHRYVIQLLVAMGKPGDTAEPLQSLIRQTPAAERPALILSLPRFFASTSDRKLVPPLLEQALETYRQNAATRPAVLQALAGAWLNAQDNDRALALAREAQQLDPTSEMPALIGLQMLPTVAAAEGLVLDHL